MFADIAVRLILLCVIWGLWLWYFFLYNWGTVATNIFTWLGDVILTRLYTLGELWPWTFLLDWEAVALIGFVFVRLRSRAFDTLLHIWGAVAIYTFYMIGELRSWYFFYITGELWPSYVFIYNWGAVVTSSSEILTTLLQLGPWAETIIRPRQSICFVRYVRSVLMSLAYHQYSRRLRDARSLTAAFAHEAHFA